VVTLLSHANHYNMWQYCFHLQITKGCGNSDLERKSPKEVATYINKCCGNTALKRWSSNEVATLLSNVEKTLSLKDSKKNDDLCLNIQWKGGVKHLI